MRPVSSPSPLPWSCSGQLKLQWSRQRFDPLCKSGPFPGKTGGGRPAVPQITLGGSAKAPVGQWGACLGPRLSWGTLAPA